VCVCVCVSRKYSKLQKPVKKLHIILSTTVTSTHYRDKSCLQQCACHVVCVFSSDFLCPWQFLDTITPKSSLDLCRISHCHGHLLCSNTQKTPNSIIIAIINKWSTVHCIQFLPDNLLSSLSRYTNHVTSGIIYYIQVSTSHSLCVYQIRWI